ILRLYPDAFSLRVGRAWPKPIRTGHEPMMTGDQRPGPGTCRRLPSRRPQPAPDDDRPRSVVTPPPTLIRGQVPPTQTRRPHTPGQHLVLHLEGWGCLAHIVQPTQKHEQRPPLTLAAVIEKAP